MKISKVKKEKIFEQILAFLYAASPNAFFTNKIAKEIARDEEFVKALLINLKEKKLVTEIRKSPKGTLYKRRRRWKLSDLAYKAYREKQTA